MRKTSSYLKGLAETRARTAGDVERLTRIHDEISQQIASAQAELAACDRLIVKFDQRLNPGLIKPIHEHRRYGKHGALLQTVRRAIEEAWPEAITTSEVSWAVQLELELHFLTYSEKKRWLDNSLRGAIKKLLARGEIERTHELADAFNGEVGRWRWKKDSCLSLDHLRLQAEAAGVEVQEHDGVPS